MLFYHLGKAVQDFWRLPLWLGQLSYDMSRTHSIMRVATTASPVSGMEVRDKMLEMQEETTRRRALTVLQIFAAKWIVAQDGITSTPLRIDRMRLVLLGKYGHETEEKKTPLVRVRREVRSPSSDLHPSPPPTPVALALALAVPTTLGELSQHLRSGAQGLRCPALLSPWAPLRS